MKLLKKKKMKIKPKILFNFISCDSIIMFGFGDTEKQIKTDFFARRIFFNFRNFFLIKNFYLHLYKKYKIYTRKNFK